MRTGDIFNIPHFLKARSAEALRVSMLENNAKKGMEHVYFDISFDGSDWYVWFYTQANEYQALTKLKDK
jgi:hypothetical protein